MVRYRRATWNDLEPLLDLIERGFSVEYNSVVNQKQGKEHRVLFSYLYSKKDWDPERVYVAEDAGRLRAAAGFFPQRLYFDGLDLPVWAVSPVVTDPEFRGRGYAGNCLVHALEDLKDQGVPAVFLWGLSGYYPRFGFVPVLPRYKTKSISGAVSEKIRVRGRFRQAGSVDLPEVAALYDQGNRDFWLQPRRDLRWWRERFAEMDIEAAELKEVPFPKKENFLVWENNNYNLSGYLTYSEGPEKIIIDEAAASDMDVAAEMIVSFMAMLNPGKTLYLRGTPRHHLNAAAYRLGGSHINPAPKAGMVKVINWPRFLEMLAPVFNTRAGALVGIKKGANFISGNINWTWNGAQGWEISFKSGNCDDPEQEKMLTRLVFGFYDQIDLKLIAGLDWEMIRHVFPEKYPFIWDNNYLY